jgi:ParB-like chromosome segregation protein Spo0J
MKSFGGYCFSRTAAPLCRAMLKSSKNDERSEHKMKKTAGGVGSKMVKSISKVREIDVATVAGNKTLAAAMDRRAVQRCKEAIEKLGVVHTPVVGMTQDGKRLLLSGQCELTALRELGVKKMDAVEVDVTDDGITKSKLSLLLISLQDRPGALCEGLLIQEALSAGVNRAEIQTILCKSASWVSNRLSLVTRLDGNVYEMVKSGLLEARSAEEVARLPQCAQFAFAEIAVREGLPKSAIESLVAGYNDEGCPDTVKAQILADPREALKRMADKRRSVNADNRAVQDKVGVPPDIIGEIIKAARLQVAALRRVLASVSPGELEVYKDTLKELEASLLALRAMIHSLFYPGKNGGGA